MKIAQAYYPATDPSHDWDHVSRVMKNALYLAQFFPECDTDILFAAVLFHDCVNPPKHTLAAKKASDNSAKEAEYVLKNLWYLSKEQIRRVAYSVSVCSFNKGIRPETIEARILQDADMLEAVGAISIMRTFCSTGQYGRPFYNHKDTFCEKRKPKPSKYAIDLFYQRLFVVTERMNTPVWKELARKRSKILYDFIDAFRLELKENKI